MTLEEILDRFETLWRAADRDNVPHFRGTRLPAQSEPFVLPVCAVLVAHQPDDREVARAASDFLGGWACGDCGFFDDDHGLWASLLHLNDEHSWSFERFAKDFRTAYREGVARWQNGIAA